MRILPNIFADPRRGLAPRESATDAVSETDDPIRDIPGPQSTVADGRYRHPRRSWGNSLPHSGHASSVTVTWRSHAGQNAR